MHSSIEATQVVASSVQGDNFEQFNSFPEENWLQDEFLTGSYIFTGCHNVCYSCVLSLVETNLSFWFYSLDIIQF